MDSKLQYFAPEQFWKCFKLWGQPVNVREQQVSPLNSIKLVITKVYGMRATTIQGQALLLQRSECFA